ncbi:uncharacterized protein LOC124162950 isoform X1 [Ischnura elegans]|uniref:uncharacterized protein LOC124162950 isoform X1 n=1 Tax=Ischnura elegans TaxID=197161 RepID=UPI001ED8B090|nr:uncharacterized protein LOC124162950 isoform X1 [Ischnura elegans]XP_046395674.1 uncharacterized protein LOC124162950 isoform X1 [Ischnura elegans]XP_046395675.1 uncharacterized protein LOC124162950 isoform X1 [Ischnura elegans]
MSRMDDDPYISSDSLECSCPAEYAVHEDVVVDDNPNVNYKNIVMLKPIPKIINLSCRSLPTYHSSNDFIHSDVQYAKLKSCTPNGRGNSKIELENSTRNQKSSYLEIFRKRMNFSGNLLPRKDNASRLQDSRGWCCIKEIPMTHFSNQVNDYSSAEVSEDRWSLNSSASQSVDIDETCNPLGVISNQVTDDERAKFESSESALKEDEKKLNKGSNKIDENHTHVLESSHSISTGVAKSKSACEGHDNIRKRDLNLITNKYSSMSCIDKNHVFTNQNKMSTFLMRNAYGNSVSDFNCKIKACSQKHKTPKNVARPAVCEESKEVNQLYDEKKTPKVGREPLKSKSLKLVTERKVERMPSEKITANSVDAQLETLNMKNSSKLPKSNKNMKTDSNSSFNLEFLLERHRRESQLLKKINGDSFKNAVV